MDAIGPYMSKYGYTLFNGPFEAGLVVRETKPWLAASVDGFVSFGTDGLEEPLQCAIEIKPMDTVAAAFTRGFSRAGFGVCQFGDATCKLLVHDVSYQMQILQHAMVTRQSTSSSSSRARDGGTGFLIIKKNTLRDEQHEVRKSDIP